MDFSSVITVLGMHRSGTSLCAHMLQALGADMADEPGVSPENAKGHWERAPINDLNERVFATFGRGWAQTSHALALPENWLEDARVGGVREALIAWLRPRVGRAGFGFKDPRTARLLPLWRQVFTALAVTPRFVFCVRDPTQVARSITARDRLATAQSEYRWLIYNAEAVLGVGRDAVCVVPYEDWFARPLETAERLAAFAGVAPDTDAVSRVVDASLRHDSFAPSPAGRMARRLHTLIEGCVDDQRFGAGVLAFCHGVVDFAQQVQPLLVDTEVLRASVLEQNRVIGDLNAALRAARLVGLKEEKAVLF
jgi:hypothetical protein